MLRKAEQEFETKKQLKEYQPERKNLYKERYVKIDIRTNSFDGKTTTFNRLLKNSGLRSFGRVEKIISIRQTFPKIKYYFFLNVTVVTLFYKTLMYIYVYRLKSQSSCG